MTTKYVTVILQFITDHPSHENHIPVYLYSLSFPSTCYTLQRRSTYNVRKYHQSHTPGTICRNFFFFFFYWLPLRSLMRLQRWLYKSYSRKELKLCGVSRKAGGEEILHLTVWCISIYCVTVCEYFYRESVYKNYVKIVFLLNYSHEQLEIL